MRLKELLLLTALCSGCATSQNAFVQRSYDERVCVNSKPTKKILVTFAAYTGPSKGMPVRDVAARVADAEWNVKLVAEEFLSAVARVAVRPDPSDLFRFEFIHNDNLDSDSIHFRSETDFHLVQTSKDGSHFILCHRTSCKGLKDPITSSLVSSGMDESSWLFNGVHYFSVSGLPNSKPLSRFVIGPWNPVYPKSHFSQPASIASDYVITSGHNIGWFVKRNYWSKTEVNCPSCSGADQRSPASERRDLDPTELIRKGSAISTRVEGPWLIKSVTFDPTEFCRYAKPFSDFFVQ